MRRVIRFSSMVLMAAVMTGCAAEGDDVSAPQAPPPPTVTTAQPLVKKITDWDEYTGRFQAVDYVEVRARVSGNLDRVAFEDGAIVNKGDLLFVIDQRPFQVALQEAQAQLSSAKSTLEFANRDLARAQSLIQRGNISQQALDQRIQAEKNAEASVAAAEAAVRGARLNLDFTEVRAPVAGRIGRDLVTVGNLISGGQAGSTLLATIVSLDPIYFYFDADEAAYLRYARLARGGERPSSREAPNPVRLALQDETDFRHDGAMDFVDNQISMTTGTVRGRAIFNNPNQLFIPGMFARMQLIASEPYEAMLLPDEAIGSDQERKFVYVVGNDGTVEYRVVELGPMNSGLRVIRKGITPQDWIIVNGLQRARPGGKVTPERKPITLPSPAPNDASLAGGNTPGTEPAPEEAAGE